MIKVTIAGPVASGKTTIAFALEDFLSQRGFTNVSIEDIDLEPGNGRTYEHNDKCMEAVKDRPVAIVTVQTH